MVKFDKINKEEDDDSRDTGGCEIAIDIMSMDALGESEELARAISNNLNEDMAVFAYERQEMVGMDGITVYTGQSRLDIQTLIEVVEQYKKVSDDYYETIPQDITIMPTTNDGDPESLAIWYEFELGVDVPSKEVSKRLEGKSHGYDTEPHLPLGPNLEASRYRLGNMSFDKARSVINLSKNIEDQLDVEGQYLVCEEL